MTGSSRYAMAGMMMAMALTAASATWAAGTIVLPRPGQVGLGLQIGGLDPARCRRAQLRHPAVVQKIGHQARDEHRLARPRQAGDAQPHHRLEAAAKKALDPAHHPVGPIRNAQTLSLRLLLPR